MSQQFCLKYDLKDPTIQNLMKFMCGRIDFYWEYLNGVPFTQKQELTPIKLKNHFEGGNALGFSPFIDNERIMFLGWDFDAHTSPELSEEENNNLIKQAQEDSLKVYEYLNRQGFRVILNSSGSKGRHVRLLCEGANAKAMRVYGHYVQWKVLGQHDKHEVFPKQDNLNETRPYGNQMKGLFCLHPKKKQWVYVIQDGEILDLENSIKAVIKELEKPLVSCSVSESEFKRIENLMSPHPIKTNNEIVDTLHFCEFIEQIATKKVLPSKGKYTRHTCLDPNIQAYSYFSPEAKQKYAEVQGRHSDTAFRNWEHYWDDGKPKMKCAQIIGYLRNNQDNINCALGLECCRQCKFFKEFILKHSEPKGWANSINIKRMAERYNFLNCWFCGKPIEFNERLGWYFCSCGNKGGLVRFAEKIQQLNKQEVFT